MMPDFSRDLNEQVELADLMNSPEYNLPRTILCVACESVPVNAKWDVCRKCQNEVSAEMARLSNEIDEIETQRKGRTVVYDYIAKKGECIACFDKTMGDADLCGICEEIYKEVNQ